MDFRKEVGIESSVVYVGQNRQLSDIVFQVERARRTVENVRTVVIS